MLNVDKTEVMAVVTSSRLRLVDSDSADIGVSNISFKTPVKYIEVKIDQTLSMLDQISSICHASFLELKDALHPSDRISQKALLQDLLPL